MKDIAIIFSFTYLLFSCDSPKKENQNVKNIDWIQGSWHRTNGKPGQETYENWNKTNDSLYTGESYTLENTDTVWQETMQLAKLSKTWSLDITGKDEPKPTKFPFTDLSKNGFTAENGSNSFPNKIEYRLENNKLKGKVSGKEDFLMFEFERINL